METQGLLHDEVGKSYFDQIHNYVKEAVYGVLFVLLKESRHSFSMVVVSSLFEMLQMLYFALDTEKSLPWRSATIEGIYDVARLTQTEFYLQRLNWSAYVALFYIFLVLVLLVIADAVYVAYSFSRRRFAVMWPVKVLRAVVGLFVTSLFIPVLEFFVFIFHCGGSGAHASYSTLQCYQGEHLGYAVSGGAVAAVFTLLCLVVSGGYFESSPKSEDMTARSEARVETLRLSFKTLLVVLYSVLHSESDLTQWIFILVILADGCSYLVLFINSLPYYNITVCKIKTVFNGIYLWAGVCLALSKLLENTGEGSAAMLFVFGIPFVVSVLLNVVEWRVKKVTSLSMDKVTSCREIEIKVRLLLQAARDSADGIDKNVLQEAESWYRQGLRKFPRSSFLHLTFAIFNLEFCKNRNNAIHHLGQVEQYDPKFDESFMLYRYRRMLTEMEGGSGLDLVSFIAFENHMHEVQKNMEKSALAHLQFWAELLEPVPNLSKLHVTGALVNKWSTACQDNFRALLKVNPNSTKAMRLYSSYLSEILNEQTQAQAILQKLQDVENCKMTTRSDAMSEGAFMDEQSAMITFSGDSANIGQIVQVNVETSRLFGYTRRDLLGKKVTMLFPSLLGRVHELLIKRACDDFEDNPHDSAMSSFGLHQSGYIFPIGVLLKPTVQRNGTVSFLLFVRSDLNHDGVQSVLVNSESGEVNGVSSGVAALFGMSLSEFEKEHRVVADLIPDFDTRSDYVLSPFFTSKGKLVQFRKSNREQFEAAVIASYVALGSELKAGLELRIQVVKKEVHESPAFTPLQRQSVKDLFVDVGVSETGVKRGCSATIVEARNRLTRMAVNFTSHVDEGADTPKMPKQSRHSVQEASDDTGESDKAVTEKRNSIGAGALVDQRSEHVAESHDDEGMEREPVKAVQIDPVDDDIFEELEKARKPSLSFINTHKSPKLEPMSPGRSSNRGGLKKGGQGARSLLSSSRHSTSVDSLRKALMTDSKNSSIRALTLAAFTMLLVAVIISAVSFSLTNQTLSGFRSRLELIASASGIRSQVVATAYGARSLSLINGGWLPSTQDAFAREYIGTNLADLEPANELLFSSLGAEGSALRSFYYEDSIVTQDIRDGLPTTYLTDVHDVLNDFSVDAHLIQDAAISSLTDSFQPVYFIMNNVDGPMMRSLFNATDRYVTASQKNAEDSESMMLTLMLVGVLTLVGFVVCLFFPVVRVVERKKDQVLRLFIDIPVPIISVLHKRCQQWIMLNVETAAARDEDNVVDQTELEFSWDEVQHELQKGKTRKFTQSFASKVSVFLKFLIFFAIVLIYFIVTFLLAQQAIQGTMPYSNEISLSDRRLYYIRMASFQTREYLALGGDSAKKKRAISLLGTLESVQSTLLEGVPSIYGRSAAHDVLLGENMCTLYSADTQDDCVALWNGALTHGLPKAQKRFSNELRNMYNLYNSSASLSTSSQQYNAINSDKMQDILKFAFHIIREGLRMEKNFFISEMQSKLDVAKVVRCVMFGLFIAIMVCLYLFFYRPFIRSLAHDIKRTQAMLLMVPLEVVNNISSIRTFLKKYAHGQA